MTMITNAIVGLMCMSIGLYAGKRRAKGLGWFQIYCEMAKGVWHMLERVILFISKPFSKEFDDGEDDEGKGGD